MAEERTHFEPLDEDELTAVSGGRTDNAETRYTFHRGDRYVDGNWKYQVVQDTINVSGDTDVWVLLYLYMTYYSSTTRKAGELASLKYAGNFEFKD